MGNLILGSFIGSVVMLGLCLLAEKNQPDLHHVSGSFFSNDPSRARLVSYTDDGDVIYWADVPSGTTEMQITIHAVRCVGSVHVTPAMTVGGMYCRSQEDGTCK